MLLADLSPNKTVKYYNSCPHFTFAQFFHSFPTLGQRAFLSTWSSWPSCSCWAPQPSRPSPTTASTPPPGCTAPPRATSLHCASGAPTGRSWRTRTCTTSARCTTGVRWESTHLTGKPVVESAGQRGCVFVCRSHAQGRRGRCWSLTPRCPARSPYSTSPCLILVTGTRNSDSRLARFATTVNRAGTYFSWSNLIKERAMDTFF